MRPFAYRRARDDHDAVGLASARPGAAYIAGGTDLMQLWKTGTCAPDLVIDISRLALSAIETRPDGVAIGALARMSDVADHPAIRDGCPAVAQALLASASPQIRNVATVGGNLLQRTRCTYFRSNTLPCNKRHPGSGCGAIDGENRLHAIFGASAHCAATHASDLAVALVALDAVVRICGEGGVRALPVEELFLLPGEHPERETVLSPGELIVEIAVPGGELARCSTYVKVRDRASFEFAVVSVAVALQVEGGVIKHARISAGGVGSKPWRLRNCEALLAGARANEAAFRAAAGHAADGAAPLCGNGFKGELLKRLVFRALTDLRGEA